MKDMKILEELMKAASETETRKEDAKMEMEKAFNENFEDMVKEEVKKIKEGKTTFEKSVSGFKVRNRFVCKIFPVPISPEEEDDLNKMYEQELKKALEEKPEEKPKHMVKDIDYYINDLSILCKSLMLDPEKSGEVAAYAAGYSRMLENIGITKTELEMNYFVKSVFDKVLDF